MAPPRLAHWLRERGKDLLSVLLPSPCAVCDAMREELEVGVCLPCWAGIDYLTGPTCPRCGRPHESFEDDDLEGTLCGGCVTRPSPFDAGLSMGAYSGTLRTLIRLLKFYDRPDLAPPLAARAAVYLRHRRPDLTAVDLVVPVPLPLPRRLRRGYNQSAELAKALGRRLDLPIAAGCLRRRLAGRPQAGLPAGRRDANVRRAFRLPNPRIARGRSILLVDDIWTTGATLRECARVLRRGGARRVIALSLARALTRPGSEVYNPPPQPAGAPGGRGSCANEERDGDQEAARRRPSSRPRAGPRHNGARPGGGGGDPAGHDREDRGEGELLPGR